MNRLPGEKDGGQANGWGHRVRNVVMDVITFPEICKPLVVYRLQSGRVVKAYEYNQTCIATKTFEFVGFLGEARNDTPNLTACCTNVPNLILLKIGHLCSPFVHVFP